MAITDELRAWTNDNMIGLPFKRDRIMEIADSIDEKHEMTIDHGVMDGDSIARVSSKFATDDELAKYGLVRIDSESDFVNAIQKLRRFVDAVWHVGSSDRDRLMALVDKLEHAHWSDIGTCAFDASGYSDVELEQAGLVRLPEDADGNVIRIGDTVRSHASNAAIPDEWQTKDTVWQLLITPDGEWNIENKLGQTLCPNDVRVVKPTPAERIRRFVSDNEDIAAGLHWEELLDVASELEGEGA